MAKAVKTTKTAAARKPAAPARSAKAPAAKAPAAKAPAARKPAAAAAKAGKAGTLATVSLKQLAAGLAESHDMPKRQVEAMLGDLIQTFSKHLKKGTKIRLNGLGIFQVRSRAARMGRNPATGEQIQIKASKKIAFRPAKELKESI
jgi:DNA-binding protein HU-beta